MTWLRYLHKLIPHQKLNDETINDSNYVLSSLLTSSSSELVQLKRVNIIRRQEQQQQLYQQNRCHQGRVVKRGATRSFKQTDAESIRRRMSSHVVVNGHRNCVLTAEKFTKIKNPIITINKNSFRTNNHFSHQSIGKLLQPIAESSVIFTTRLPQVPTATAAITRKPHESSLCSSCIRIRADMNRNRCCRCCGRELAAKKRHGAAKRHHHDDEHNHHSLVYRQNKQLVNRVHFRAGHDDRVGAKSMGDAKMCKKSQQLVLMPPKAKKPCLKKYIATVNTQAIDKYRGNLNGLKEWICQKFLAWKYSWH